MKLALVQMCSGFDRVENFAMFETLAQIALGADVVITPECSNIRAFRKGQDEALSLDKDPFVLKTQEWAKRHGTAVILGSVIVKDPKRDGLVNRQLFINAEGRITAFYDKIHMFDVALPNGESFRESETYTAGEEAVISTYKGVKFGHSICYDIRFPALYRCLAFASAELIVVPAAFTWVTGQAHWKVLLRARAIETGAFIVAPGQCGSYTHHDGSTRANWGHSLAVSPWGEVLTEMDEETGVSLVDLDLQQVKQTRSQIPAWNTESEFTLKTYE